MTHVISNETAVLLEAASVGTCAESDERLARLLARGVDGPRFLELALRHRIVPLLHTRLRGLGRPELVDPALFEELDAWARRFQLGNLTLAQELGELLELLGDQGIRVTPYKGPLLALALYGDLGQRAFYDLDLLVRKQDLGRVRSLMLARGYALTEEGSELDQHLEHDCELHFVRPADGLLVEMHWDVLPSRYRRGLDIEDYWARLVPGRIFGAEIEVLGHEDLLIVLAIHGGEKHRWSRIQMLVDVARMLDRLELDWEALLARARSLGRTDTVLLGVYLAWSLLGAPLPEAVLAEAASPRIRAQAALTLGRFTRLDGGLPSLGVWRACAAALDARVHERGASPGPALGRCHYLKGILTPEWTDHQGLALPRALSWGYYVYRPLRLLRKHGGSLLGRI